MTAPDRTTSPDIRCAGTIWAIAGLNAAVFAAILTASAFGVDLLEALALPASSPRAYQALSYMFAHAGLLHILVNMLVFVAYGSLASTLGLGHAVAPLYLAGGLAGAAGFGLFAAGGSMLAGASASVLAVLTAITLWCGSLRVAIPWAGRPRLWAVSVPLAALAVCSALGAGESGALAAHVAGLLAGLLAALVFFIPGRGRVRKWLSSRREYDSARLRVLDKARFSGYSSLTEAERKLL